MNIKLKSFFSLSLILISIRVIGQSIPIGESGTDDMLRLLQLTGKIDVKQSLTARPFFNFTKSDSVIGLGYKQKVHFRNFLTTSILPLTITSKINTTRPYGWNDAGMILANGFQVAISAGIYTKIGPLSIQFRPEFYYAANAAYDYSPSFGSTPRKNITNCYPGQSSARLNLGRISFGVSTENLWWGPGQVNSLMMSNNAPGFQHLTLNSIRPLLTPIGSFEFQLIAGKLNEDTSAAFENNYLIPYYPKSEWRYLNGIVLTYQPKFLPNFFFGVTRSEHLYQSDLNRKSGFIKKYLPVFVGSSPSANADASSVPSDGAFSFFGRWILPKHRAEFYLEYGYNDFKQNLRDFSVNANHAAAYIAGFKKIIDLQSNRLLDVSGEITQMAQSTSYVVRNAGNWYEHSGVWQGYTHKNQILGAGSGIGNNVQTLELRLVRKLDFFGMKFQRIQIDPKGVRGDISAIAMRRFQWNDLSIGFLGQQKFNRFLISGELQLVHSKNYGWEKGNKMNLYSYIRCSYFF